MGYIYWPFKPLVFVIPTHLQTGKLSPRLHFIPPLSIPTHPLSPPQLHRLMVFGVPYTVCKRPKLDAQRLQSVTSIDCQCDIIHQHRLKIN